MVQDSIVDYINAQMKLGISRDAIKTTLTGAGWQAADVEDTLKKIEGARMAQPMATVAAAAAVKPTMAEPMVAAKPVGGVNPAPQTIRVSDLVSSSASPAPMTMSSKSPLTGPTVSATAASAAASPAGATKISTASFKAQTFSADKVRGSRGPLITEIILGVLVIVFGAVAGFLYMQNNGLNTQLSSLNGQSSGVNSQLSALQAQVAASTTALTAQVTTLNGDNQELKAELSFLVLATGTTPGASTTATISGTVAAGKTGYIITGTYGTKISVANSKAASVISALAPLMATTGTTTSTTATSTSPATSTVATSTAPVAPTAATTAQFTGTYVPGSDAITLTEVNGTSL